MWLFCRVFVIVLFSLANAVKADELWVPSSYYSGIDIIDTDTDTVIQTVPFNEPDQIEGIIFSPNGENAYFANQRYYTPSLLILDAENKTFIATITLDDFPMQMALDSTGTTMYLPLYATKGQVVIIDTATHTIFATISVGSGGFAKITSDDAFVWEINIDSNNVSIIDTSSLSIIATITTNILPRVVEFTQDGGYAYVGCTSRTLLIDISNLTVVATITMSPVFGMEQEQSKIYISQPPADNILILDTSSNAIIATITSGRGPHTIISNLDGLKMFVGNISDSSISVIDTNNYTVITTITLSHYSYPTTMGIRESPPKRSFWFW